MQVHFGFENAVGIRNPVVTTGSFDGVHIGHKTILNRLNEIAEQIDGESVLVSFYPHPRKVLYPETQGRDLQFICSHKEKIVLLEKAGLKHLILVRFNLEFSKNSSEDFIRKLLVGALNAKYIIVGFNHHFGHNRQGDFSNLYSLSQELDFGVEEIPEQDIHHETVSSTTIRKALKEGRIQRANAYLDHQYMIIGALGRGSNMFSQVGFPTLRVQIEEAGKLIPPTGIYAVTLFWGQCCYKAMAVVSGGCTADTLQEVNVDVHILNFDGILHSDEGTLLFQKAVRFDLNLLDQNILKEQLTYGFNEVDELIY